MSLSRIGLDLAEVEEAELPPEKKRFAEEYLKIGMFLHLNPDEFENMDLWLIDYVNNEIDSRLSQYAPQEPSDGEGKMPLDFQHLGLLLALSQLFGGKPDS